MLGSPTASQCKAVTNRGLNTVENPSSATSQCHHGVTGRCGTSTGQRNGAVSGRTSRWSLKVSLSYTGSQPDLLVRAACDQNKKGHNRFTSEGGVQAPRKPRGFKRAASPRRRHGGDFTYHVTFMPQGYGAHAETYPVYRENKRPCQALPGRQLTRHVSGRRGYRPLVILTRTHQSIRPQGFNLEADIPCQ